MGRGNKVRRGEASGDQKWLVSGLPLHIRHYASVTANASHRGRATGLVGPALATGELPEAPLDTLF